MELECPQHQDGGHQGQVWSNRAPLGLSPLPLAKPWTGTVRVGAMEWERLVMAHGGARSRGWGSGWDIPVLAGAIPCISDPGAQEPYLLCETSHGFQPTLATLRPVGQAWGS